MKRIIAFIAALAFLSGGICYAQEQEQEQEQEREQVQEQEPIREYSKFRFGLEGGGGFRLGKISNDVSDDFKSYTKKLRRGFVYGADATWFFKEFMGVGLRYKAFSASNGTTVTGTDENGTTVTGKLKDNIQISFIGPMFCTRFSSRNGLHALTADIGVGYINYRDKGMVIEKMKLTGGTLGLLYNIGYDYALNKMWSIGVNLSSIEGTLTTLTLEQNGVKTSQTTLDKDKQENISHIDLSFTLKLNL